MFTAKDAVTIHCKLIVTGGEQEIKLVVAGSPLSAASPDRLRPIHHDINRRFIEIFQGR